MLDLVTELERERREFWRGNPSQNWHQRLDLKQDYDWSRALDRVEQRPGCSLLQVNAETGGQGREGAE